MCEILYAHEGDNPSELFSKKEQNFGIYLNSLHNPHLIFFFSTKIPGKNQGSPLLCFFKPMRNQTILNQEKIFLLFLKEYTTYHCDVCDKSNDKNVSNLVIQLKIPTETTSNLFILLYTRTDL